MAAPTSLYTAVPDSPGSPLWDVHAGPHRGRPFAGLSFSPARRAPITMAGLRFAVEAAGPAGGRRRFSVTTEPEQPHAPAGPLPRGEVVRNGRSGTLLLGDRQLTLSRRWRLQFPGPTTRWTWRTETGTESITIGRPCGIAVRAVEIRWVPGPSDGERPDVAAALPLLAALWIYLDHHAGRPAGLADALGGL